MEHFYHVGSTENLRNGMQEALVIKPGWEAEAATEPGIPESINEEEALMLFV